MDSSELIVRDLGATIWGYNVAHMSYSAGINVHGEAAFSARIGTALPPIEVQLSKSTSTFWSERPINGESEAYNTSFGTDSKWFHKSSNGHLHDKFIPSQLTYNLREFFGLTTTVSQY